MKDKRLALYGGNKEIRRKFEPYQSIGEEERIAVDDVMKNKVLSKFIGGWGADFNGGEKVKQFEKDWAEYFGVKHAISVNSWTSGLITILGAIGIEPGDEVIVTPWTMCATATAILHWNAIPIFADIEERTFNIDPREVIKKISHKTKAIMAVDIFGQSCDTQELKRIANENGLILITDTAQAPGAKTRGKFTGTLSDIGGYSLNYHKHIHTGEGGMIITNNDEYNNKARLIRNHAEAAIVGSGMNELKNMVGYNFRLGEIECAIGIEQLKKLDSFVRTRQQAASKITKGLENLAGLVLPHIETFNTHAYYMYPMVLDLEKVPIKREIITKALRAEGLEGITDGYVNVHMLPIFQKKIAFGSKGFPWIGGSDENTVEYMKGSCPIAEKLHNETFIGFEMCLHKLNEEDINDIIKVFHKVWQNLDKLREIEE